MKKIGILAGTFDPVHNGHLTLAEAAMKQAQLDKVYFLPEIKPRRKPAVSHFAHRLAMLKLATAGNKNLGVLELPDVRFSVVKTLPRLLKKFAGKELFLIMGADEESAGITSWPYHERLITEMTLVIAPRKLSKQSIKKMLPENSVILNALSIPAITSHIVRQQIDKTGSSDLTVPSVAEYANRKWLYSSETLKSL